MTHDRETAPTPARRPATTDAPAGLAQPAPTSRPRTSTTARRLTLSPLIRAALDSAAERRRQRRRLVSTLILAQLLLTLAVAVGYFGSRAPLPVLVALVAALVIYLVAFLVNSLFHHATMASYILIVGGGAAVTGQVVTAALTGQPVETAQSALFFLAIMLESGLLFASEVTLILACVTTCLTAAALFLSLVLGPVVSRREAYLVVVYTLSLQALVGLISWLLAQFVSESVDETQRAQELQFAQARLDALRAQMEEQRRQLLGGIAAIQSTIAHAFGGDLDARVEPLDGELSDLAQSINALLRRVEAAARAETDPGIERLPTALGRPAEPAPPRAEGLVPRATNAPMERAASAVTPNQVNVAHRVAQVQKLAGEIAGAVGHSNDGLSTATEEVTEAQRLAGLLVAMADRILTATQKQLDLVARARRTLGGLLPEDLARLTAESLSSLPPEEAARLRGLALDLGLAVPGGTGQFTRILPIDADEAPMAPLTRPLPAVEGDEATTPMTAAQVDSLLAESAAKSRENESGAHTTYAPDIPQEVVDTWGMLGQIAEEIGQEERGISNLTHELGLLSAAVRRVDAGVAWAMQALEAVRQGAEQLQRAAGSPLPPPDPNDPRPANPSRPNPPGGVPRIPQLSRPLSENPPPAGGDETLAELAGELGAGENPAPGSLRASDLVNLEDLPDPGPEAGV